MKYQVEWMESKTSANGNDYIKATVKGEDGITSDVSVWPDFPQYKDITPGATVEGVVQTKGKFKNLVAGNLGAKPASLGKTKMIEQAQENKARYVAAAQTNREHGIKVSSTIRMAVDCAVAEHDVSPENIEKWRGYFWRTWDKEETSEPPF